MVMPGITCQRHAAVVLAATLGLLSALQASWSVAGASRRLGFLCGPTAFAHPQLPGVEAQGLSTRTPASRLQSSVQRRAVVKDLDGRVKGSGEGAYKINEQIRATEVRVVKVVSDDAETGGTRMEETNEVMTTRDALAIAREKGVDLIMIMEDKDPPLAVIASLGKFVYQAKKKEKVAATNAKQPDQKEVKISYTIGDHDLMTKLKMAEKWLKNKRQQVRITVVMKGRTKMFEKQARELLDRARREVASFGNVPGVEKGVAAVSKDGRGDLVMMLNSGADRSLLKEILAEAAPAAKKQAAAAVAAAGEEGDDDGEEGGDDDEEGEEESEEADEADGGEEEGGDGPDGELGQELADLEAEVKQTREDLLECGISASQLSSQEEMQDLNRRMADVQARIAASAFGSTRSGWLARSFSVALVGGAFAALRQPHRWQRLR